MKIEDLLTIKQNGENWLASFYVKRNKYNNQIVIVRNDKDVLTLTDDDLKYFSYFINTDNVMRLFFNIHNRMDSTEKVSIIVEEGAFIYAPHGEDPILGILVSYKEHVEKCISMNSVVHSVPITLGSTLPSEFDDFAYEYNTIRMAIEMYPDFNSFPDLGLAVLEHIKKNYSCL